MSLSYEEMMEKHIDTHYVLGEGDSECRSFHTHGFEKFGLPEFCFNAMNMPDSDVTAMAEAVSMMYYEFITDDTLIVVNSIHVFDKIKMSDGGKLAFAFLPAVCFDEPCLMVVRVSPEKEDHGRIINDIDFYVNHDNWNETRIDTGILLRFHVADLFGCAYNGGCAGLNVMQDTIIRYCTDTNKSYKLYD